MSGPLDDSHSAGLTMRNIDKIHIDSIDSFFYKSIDSIDKNRSLQLVGHHPFRFFGFFNMT